MLSLAVCDALNGNKDIVLPFACAIELITPIHLFMMIFPAWITMTIEGKPTSHKVLVRL